MSVDLSAEQMAPVAERIKQWSSKEAIQLESQVTTSFSTSSMKQKGSAPPVPAKPVFRRWNSTNASEVAPVDVPACPSPTITPAERLLKSVLKKQRPYPMVVKPENGGYWIDGLPAVSDRNSIESYGKGLPVKTSDSIKCILEMDNIGKCYDEYFRNVEHLNFYAYDDSMGPILVSIKTERRQNIRILLRTRSRTQHEMISISYIDASTTPYKLCKRLNPQITTKKFRLISCPEELQLISKFDGHAVVSTYKFGVLYQSYGQTTEYELFSNNDTTPAFNEFLQMIGHQVKLRDHKGYRASMDVRNGLTGEFAVYESFKGIEIMYHVTTLFPYAIGDAQHVNRKCHIGNDIVAIVFQEENTPFTPTMIKSNFLHVFIVVQPIDPLTPNTRYKVAITARDDVPEFGPPLPTPAIFQKGPEFKEFLLTKLINAELASYKANRFSILAVRTRANLLEDTVDKLKKKTIEQLKQNETINDSDLKVNCCNLINFMPCMRGNETEFNKLIFASEHPASITMRSVSIRVSLREANS